MVLKRYYSFVRVAFNTSIVNTDTVVELVQTTYKTGAFQVFKAGKPNRTKAALRNKILPLRIHNQEIRRKSNIETREETRPRLLNIFQQNTPNRVFRHIVRFVQLRFIHVFSRIYKFIVSGTAHS